MDGLTFTNNLIAALAWPTMVLAALILLRRPVSGLLDRVEKVKYPGGELEIGRQLAEVRETADEANLPTPVQVPDDLVRIASVSPQAATLAAWREVELAIREVSQRAGVAQLGPSMTIRRTVRSLTERHVLDYDTAGVIQDLQGLRNSIAHSSDVQITSVDAHEYIRLARRVLEKLRSAPGP